jgi:hypothetical protein
MEFFNLQYQIYQAINTIINERIPKHRMEKILAR